jgi:hypothetical protein
LAILKEETLTTITGYYKCLKIVDTQFFIFDALKKIVAILFLTVYVLSATEAHQLLKLPFIFQHFSDHRQGNSHITFMQFLDMHYMHGSPKDKDYQDDMKLPFKSADNCTAALSPAFVPTVNLISEIKIVELPKIKGTLRKSDFIPSAYLSSIWQPPKSCKVISI